MCKVFVTSAIIFAVATSAYGASDSIYVCLDEKSNKKVMQHTPCGSSATVREVKGSQLSALPPQTGTRDAYGNTVRPEVAKKLSEDSREQAVKNAIEQHQTIRGMTEAEVVSSLGKPDKINNNGGFVQWVYKSSGGDSYVYFENGKVR